MIVSAHVENTPPITQFLVITANMGVTKAARIVATNIKEKTTYTAKIRIRPAPPTTVTQRERVNIYVPILAAFDAGKDFVDLLYHLSRAENQTDDESNTPTTPKEQPPATTELYGDAIHRCDNCGEHYRIGMPYTMFAQVRDSTSIHMCKPGKSFGVSRIIGFDVIP